MYPQTYKATILKTIKNLEVSINKLPTLKQVLSSGKIDFRIAKSQRIDKRSQKTRITYKINDVAIESLKTLLNIKISLDGKKKLPSEEINDTNITTIDDYEKLINRKLDSKTDNLKVINLFLMFNKLGITYHYKYRRKLVTIELSSYAHRYGFIPLSFFIKVRDIDANFSPKKIDKFIDSKLIASKIPLVIASLVTGRVTRKINKFNRQSTNDGKIRDIENDTFLTEVTVNKISDLLALVKYTTKYTYARYQDNQKIKLVYYLGENIDTRKINKLKNYENQIRDKKPKLFDDSKSQTTFNKKTKTRLSSGGGSKQQINNNLFTVTEKITYKKMLLIAEKLYLGYDDPTLLPRINLVRVTSPLPKIVINFLNYKKVVEKTKIDGANILAMVAVNSIPDSKISPLVNTRENITIVGILVKNKKNKIFYYNLPTVTKYLPEYIKTGEIVERKVVKYKKPDGEYITYDAANKTYVNKSYELVSIENVMVPQYKRLDHNSSDAAKHRKYRLDYQNITPLFSEILSAYGMRDNMPVTITHTTYTENTFILQKYFKCLGFQAYPVDKLGNTNWDETSNIPLTYTDL